MHPDTPTTILLLRSLLIHILILGCYGCRMLSPEAPPVDPAVGKTPKTSVSVPDGRVQTAQSFARKAAELLRGKKPDDAISLLERSISLDPENWLAYYLAAEGWLQKSDFRQALEYNRLAEIHSHANLDWKKKVWKQKTRIEELRQ